MQYRHHKSLPCLGRPCAFVLKMTSLRFFSPRFLMRSSLLALALCMPVAHLLPAHAQLALPSMGDGADITTSEERRIGDRIIRSLYRDPDYVDDPQLHAYVMQIWQPLVDAAKQRGELSDELSERFAWKILLGRDESINAFALPGGYLGVHLGLIAAVSSRDELATVLAHELTHVTQRHIARMVGEEKKSMPLLVAGMVLGALAASKSPDAANALIMGGQAAAIQNQLGFSREMEREADRIGFGLLAPAGFAPQGAVSMFEKLQQASRLNDNGSWPYLRSHPLTTERIADMQARLPQSSGASPRVQPTMEAAMMSARARVLGRPSTDQLREWTKRPQLPEFSKLAALEQAAQWYAAALSQSRLGEPQQALGSWKALDALLAQQGDAAARQQARWLRMEIELAAGPGQAALQWVAADGDIAQNSRPELLLSSQALLAAGHAAKASDRLQLWLVDHPDDASAWQLLAQAWQAQGRSLRALRAEAESHAVRYDYAAAVDRFKAGQDVARSGVTQADHIDASIIDTRLREVQSLLREQAREK